MDSAFLFACDKLGFEPVEVITSDDIMRCQPDCVLVTHEFSPKLTPFPTLGFNGARRLSSQKILFAVGLFSVWMVISVAPGRSRNGSTTS